MASANAHLVCRWIFAGEARSPASGRAKLRDSSKWHGSPFGVFSVIFLIVLMTQGSDGAKPKNAKKAFLSRCTMTE